MLILTVTILTGHCSSRRSPRKRVFFKKKLRVWCFKRRVHTIKPQFPISIIFWNVRTQRASSADVNKVAGAPGGLEANVFFKFQRASSSLHFNLFEWAFLTLMLMVIPHSAPRTWGRRSREENDDVADQDRFQERGEDTTWVAELTCHS